MCNIICSTQAAHFMGVLATCIDQELICLREICEWPDTFLKQL